MGKVSHWSVPHSIAPKGVRGQAENAGGLQPIPSFSQVSKSNLDEGECKQVASSSSECRVYVLGFAARKSCY
jgi:hypothetical protein